MTLGCLAPYRRLGIGEEVVLLCLESSNKQDCLGSLLNCLVEFLLLK